MNCVPDFQMSLRNGESVLVCAAADARPHSLQGFHVPAFWTSLTHLNLSSHCAHRTIRIRYRVLSTKQKAVVKEQSWGQCIVPCNAKASFINLHLNASSLMMPSGAKAPRMPDLVPFALSKKLGKYLLFILSYF